MSSCGADANVFSFVMVLTKMGVVVPTAGVEVAYGRGVTPATNVDLNGFSIGTDIPCLSFLALISSHFIPCEYPTYMIPLTRSIPYMYVQYSSYNCDDFNNDILLLFIEITSVLSKKALLICMSPGTSR